MSVDRENLVRMISENRNLLSDPQRIQALFEATADDLVAAGLDRVRVDAAMIRAWVTVEIRRVGKAAVVETLREVAELVERKALFDGTVGHA